MKYMLMSVQYIMCETFFSDVESRSMEECEGTFKSLKARQELAQAVRMPMEFIIERVLID